MTKRPKQASHDGFGILNPYGDMWTSEIFNTIGGAKSHLKSFWQFQPDKDLSEFKIVRARLVARYLGEAPAA